MMRPVKFQQKVTDIKSVFSICLAGQTVLDRTEREKSAAFYINLRNRDF